MRDVIACMVAVAFVKEELTRATGLYSPFRCMIGQPPIWRISAWPKASIMSHISNFSPIFMDVQIDGVLFSDVKADNIISVAA